MKPHVSTTIFAVLGFSLAFAHAQAQPKIVISPPSNGEVSWTVKYKYERPVESIVAEKKADLAEQSLELADLMRPEKIKYVVKKGVSFREASYEGGTKDKAFQLGNYEYVAKRNPRGVFVHDLSSYPSVEQLYRKVFPGVHWVKPELFVGIAEAYGQKAAHFRDGKAALPDAEKMDEILDSSKYGVREAWFSLESGLPLGFAAEGVSGEFSFEAAPSGNVSLPSEIRAAMQKQLKIQEFKRRRAALTKE